jgi:hypothetical protein
MSPAPTPASEAQQLEEREALICVDDPELLKQVVNSIDGLRFSSPFSVEDAVARLKAHYYEVILISDTFRCESRYDNEVLVAVSHIAIDQRRTQFVVLISRELPTADALAAFAAGVDVVVNASELDRTGRLIWAGRTEKKVFYRRYLDTLENMILR